MHVRALSGTDLTPARSVVPKKAQIKGLYGPNKPVCGGQAGRPRVGRTRTRGHFVTSLSSPTGLPAAVAASGEWILAVERVCSLTRGLRGAHGGKTVRG